MTDELAGLKPGMRRALEQAQRQQAQRDRERTLARAEQAPPDAPLTPAERQRRHRAKLRGEHVEPRRPGPVTRGDRLRAVILEQAAQIASLEELLEERDAEIEQLRRLSQRRRIHSGGPAAPGK